MMKNLSPTLVLLSSLVLFRLQTTGALFISPICHQLNARGYSCGPSSRCHLRLLPAEKINCSPPLSQTPQPFASNTLLYSSGDDEGLISNESSNVSSASLSSNIEAPLPLTLTVGIVTSILGFIYGKCMKHGFRLMWKTIPQYLFHGSPTNVLMKFIQQYPTMYIILMTTFGGATVAYLSSRFGSIYSAHDYVHILSKDEDVFINSNDKKDVFPSARVIWPIMGLCLVTSLSGFSLGPEAPMVAVGSLAGASLARKYHKAHTTSNAKSTSTIPPKHVLEKTLAYAGAAGSLTGFMNIPIAGPIFALEMTSRHIDVATSAVKSWKTSIIASLVGISFLRGLLMPSAGIGGHFNYISGSAVGLVNGAEMIAVGLGCGVGGAIVGTCFHTTVRFLKDMLWSKKKLTIQDAENLNKDREILKKVAVALAIGVLSTQYPQTMFWGEGSLQCMVDGQCTPFAATPHGLPMPMLQWAKVNPNVALSSWYAAIQVGLAKFFAIALASAAKFPGGVIFPLLSNGAGLSQSLIQGLGTFIPGLASSMVAPSIVMSMMAATLTSITRTPLASCFILTMTASGITPLSVFMPGVLLASYVSVFVSERLSKGSFFEYSS